MFANGVDKSRNFGKYLAWIAGEQKCSFLDAGEVIQPHPNDGIHFDDVAHKKIWLAISVPISELLK